MQSGAREEDGKSAAKSDRSPHLTVQYVQPVVKPLTLSLKRLKGEKLCVHFSLHGGVT